MRVTSAQKDANGMKPSVIKGHFDRIEKTLSVWGWARSDEPNSQAQISVYVDDELVAESVTDRARPDLISHGLDPKNAGFLVRLPRNIKYKLTSHVTVKANNQILKGSPKPLIDRANVKIHQLGIEKGHLIVSVTGYPGELVDACILVDGKEMGNLTLTPPKGPSQHVPYGEKKGKWRLPSELVDGQPHVFICVLREGDLKVCSDLSIFRYPQYHIHIDTVRADGIKGWAFREGNNSPLHIALYHGDSQIGETTAAAKRTDVGERYSLTEAFNCGFTLKLPYTKDGLQGKFILVDQDTQIALAEISVADPYETMARITNLWRSSKSPHSSSEINAVLAPLINTVPPQTAFDVKKMPRVSNAEKPKTVTVIIPVYSGSVETQECIESVLSSTNQTSVRIVIINDLSPSEILNDYLDNLEARHLPDVQIFSRTKNGGFSQAVNRGMLLASDTDVILLNSDTIVHNDWVDRLHAVAYQEPEIATVTPFTNNGEICSVPYLCVSSDIPTKSLAAEIDVVASNENHGKLVELPVAVGFCMFMKRSCINDIGFFDSATWGRGYGEEVDFCLKATAHGWKHVLAADTFVVHRGGVSFGKEKLKRVRENGKIISEKYPFYNPLIQRFLRHDPPASLRRKINLTLASKYLSKERVLHLSHTYGGGTDQYVFDLSSLYMNEGTAPIVLRFDSNGAGTLSVDVSGTPLSSFFNGEYTAPYNVTEQHLLLDDLKTLGINNVHIHSVFGLKRAFIEQLTDQFTYSVTIHDYAWICPRVTLSTPDGRSCEKLGPDGCQACVRLYGPHDGLKLLYEDVEHDLVAYRAVMRKVIAGARVVYTASQDVVSRLKAHGADANFKVRLHPVVPGSPLSVHRPIPPTSHPGSNLKVAIIGAISPVKGYYKLLECARYARARDMPVSFIVFGYTMDNEKLTEIGNVTIAGKYQPADLNELIATYNPDLCYFPNQWPETFSYTLSHAFRLGLWPIVSDIGVPAERVRSTGFGSLIPADASAADAMNLIFEVAQQLPQLLAKEYRAEQFPEQLMDYL